MCAASNPERDNPSKRTPPRSEPINFGRYLVCFRCWPGFTDQFPYQDFIDLPNAPEESLKAVRGALAKEVWRDHEKILADRIDRKKRYMEALHADSMRVMGPRRSFRNKQAVSIPSSFYGKQSDWFLKLAKQVGWHSGGECPVWDTSSGRAYYFSPLIYLVAVDGEELAKGLIDELNGLKMEGNSEDREVLDVLNPRYEYQDTEGLKASRLTSALAQITRLRSGEKNTIWDPVAARHLPRVDDFIKSWWEVAKKQDPSPEDGRTRLPTGTEQVEGDQLDTEPGEVVSDLSANDRTRMSVEQANERVNKLAKSDPNFVNGKLREWAAAVGCSPGTTQKTELWKVTMKICDRGRKDKPPVPQTVTLTDGFEAALGEGTPHQVLEDLIREQAADYEASPLDSVGRNPINHR